MVMATRVAGNEKGKDNGNKGGKQQRGREQRGDCDGNKSGGQAAAMVRKRGIAMATATRVAGRQQQWQQRG